MASTLEVQKRPSGLRNLTDSTILPKLFIVMMADFQPSGTVGSWQRKVLELGFVKLAVIHLVVPVVVG